MVRLKQVLKDELSNQSNGIVSFFFVKVIVWLATFAQFEKHIVKHEKFHACNIMKISTLKFEP